MAKTRHEYMSKKESIAAEFAMMENNPSLDMIKTEEQIDGIRASGKINTALLDYITPFVHVGVNTEQLDQLIYTKTLSYGAIPAPLNYNGYPKSICTSINNVVCHGIPSEYTCLQDGDILNIDVSTIYNGYFSDSSRMFCVGKVSKDRQHLVRVAKECLELALKEVRAWSFLGNIAQAVEDHAKKYAYSVVEEIGGHGIGLEFHEEPWVAFTGRSGTSMRLVPGLVFTIEPIINQGSPKVFTKKNDSWTHYSLDGKASAQWENTVLVTETGYEILAH